MDYYILFIVGSAATVRAAPLSTPLFAEQADKTRVAHTRIMDPILDILFPFLSVLLFHICQCVRFMARYDVNCPADIQKFGQFCVTPRSASNTRV